MSNPLASTAILLADRGWHVFPLAPGAKVPMRETAGQNEATSDVETVAEWWTRYPDANIGVHCRPSGLYVIDLDRHAAAADGVETWRSLIAEHHGHRPTTTVRTGGGGYHLYYAAPPGVELRNTAGVLGPGVDTRGNGYVVAPPSVVDGRPYAPTRPRRPVAPLPDWIVEALTTPRRPATSAPTPPIATGGASSVWDRLAVLAQELAAAPEGEGNHTAARVAYMAGGYVGAGQVTAEQASSVLASGMSSWTFRRESHRTTMLNTIDRQIANGSANPRPWK